MNYNSKQDCEQMALGLLIVGAIALGMMLASGCTVVRINQGDGSGDIYVDRSKGLRSAIAEDGSQADSAGENAAPSIDPKLTVPLSLKAPAPEYPCWVGEPW